MSRRLILWLLIIFAFVWFISAIQSILLPFIVGGLLAYFLDPLADRLEARGMSRGAASALIIGVFFLLFAGVLILLIPALLREASAFAQALPGYIASLRAFAEQQVSHLRNLLPAEQAQQAKDAVSDSADKLAPAAKKIVAGVFNSGRAVVSFVTLIVITPVTGFYLLRDWDKAMDKMHELLPRDYAPTIREQLHLIDQTISGYLHGMLNVMLILAVFYIIGLSAVGLDYAILIGIVGGVAIIIPYLGTILSGGLAVGMAYLQFDSMTPVIITLVIFTVGQILEGYVLTPKLVGDKIGLHPLWLIFGMLAGGALFGFAGILLAIPASAIIGVLTRFALKQYEHSSLYLGHEKS
jgi:predicted PurR-regulated permease PerM